MGLWELVANYMEYKHTWFESSDGVTAVVIRVMENFLKMITVSNIQSHLARM